MSDAHFATPKIDCFTVAPVCRDDGTQGFAVIEKDGLTVHELGDGWKHYCCTPTPEPELLCDTIGDTTVQRPINTPNTGWNNESVLGSQAISGDLKLTMTVDAATGNTPQMVGLNSDPGTNASYTSIDYAMYFYVVGGTRRVYIYENGTYRGLFVNPFTIGDEFCIRRTGTTIEYLRNGSVFYTSTVASSLDLTVDSSFYYAAGFWGSGSITLGGIELCQI